MPISRTSLFKHIFYPLVYGIGIGGLIIVMFYPDQKIFGKVFMTEMGYSVILSFVIWKGNSLVLFLINKKYSWIKHTRKILVLHFTFTFGYSFFIIFLFHIYIWYAVMHRTVFAGFFEDFKFSFFICFAVTAIMSLASSSFNFFKHWKQSVIDGERLKREAVVFEYESLKNQVNPHFLFNSLNALTSLIDKSPDSAIHYVKQLSNVFRYVLDQHTRELVSADTELKFIESYIYLQKIRFGDKLIVDICLKDTNFLMVPMALQILLENAIKHNEVSDEKQLKISVYDDSDYLIVENSLQPKDYIVDSSQVGLKTLTFQYGYLSGKSMEIKHDEKQFRVRLPKLTEEK